MKALLFVAMVLSVHGFGQISLEELRMEKRFGIGLAAGGGYAVMGIDADVNVSEAFSIGGGIGTGIDYSTFTAKARYFLLGKYVSPYAGIGFSRWWSNGMSPRQIGPSVLVNNFLDKGTRLEDGFSVFLMYPAVGVQYMHPSGIEVSFEVQYLFKMFNFANGTYASLSAHWFF